MKFTVIGILSLMSNFTIIYCRFIPIRAFPSQRTLFEFDNFSILKKNNNEMNKAELNSSIISGECNELLEETSLKSKKNY